MPWQRAVFGEFHRLWNAIRETASKLEVPTASVETRTPFELPVFPHVQLGNAARNKKRTDQSDAQHLPAAQTEKH